MKKIKKSSEFIINNGLLFEINRKVLHPLGLALEVEVSDEGVVSFGDLWDCREYPEGILFEAEAWKSGKEKLDRYMKESGQAALDSRQKILGYVLQESE